MTSPVSPGATARIRLRRAWSEDWEKVDPILADGEPGFDKTQNMLKIGDGKTPWNELSYLTPPTPDVVLTGDVAFDEALASHINDQTPHPVYDDGPSLVLLYQNAKV
jgi:hypothetical protein